MEKLLLTGAVFSSVWRMAFVCSDGNFLYRSMKNHTEEI